MNPGNDNPYEYFTPPGVVGVSEAALTMSREFDEHVKRTISADGWVVGFEWFTRQRVRLRPDAPWEDLGPGLGLGAYARSDVPPGAIHRVDGVAFVIKIPREVYAASPERLIDVDPTAPSKFVLR